MLAGGAPGSVRGSGGVTSPFPGGSRRGGSRLRTSAVSATLHLRPRRRSLFRQGATPRGGGSAREVTRPGALGGRPSFRDYAVSVRWGTAVRPAARQLILRRRTTVT